MSKAMLVVGIILLAIITFGVVNIVSNYQTGNELDYYLLRETAEAAMTDAVDVGYYRLSGLLRIDKEKFVESFIRRFAQNVSNNRTYDIGFYDINETPPKVSVLVKSETAASVNGEGLDLTNKVDVILESNYYKNKLVTDMTRAGELDYSDVDK
ncbi:MAG TPA: hypothetical protein IAB38_00460 [Candidatus Onthousia excrementipullorum]|uniref:Uncharacterized protein n=1 Tax=Candidatus Onthousia excrementipullorum TaxID=2840884 RepID=A0A9D1DT94_9FIRM|nr:hypothetical protein [Candidatus Onthousia excrementipullorum]